MILTKFSAAAFAGFLCLGVVGPAFAQDAVMLHGDDAINARKADMRSNGKTLKEATGAQGDNAIALAQTLIDNFTALKDLFPEDSMTGDTKAKPEIWSDPDGFMVALNNASDAANVLLVAGQANDEAAYGAALKAMGGACGACHSTYRAR